MRPWPLAMFLVAACAPGTQPTDTRPVLRITGAETVMARLMPMLTDTHEKTVGTMHFELTPEATADGIRALLDGDADIAAAGRKHLPAEEEQARANGYSLDADGARAIVAMDVVALASNPRNPLDSLTYDQVIGIWCTARIDNWSALGLDPAPIRALTPAPLSGNRALFEDFFCGPQGINPKIEVVSETDMKGILADDPNAIGYSSMAEISGKILGLRPDVNGPAVHPSQQNVVRGSYPLYHDLYLYTAGPATGPAKVFLDWIASPAGQEVVDEARFVPLFLRTQRMDEPRPLRETIQFEPGSSVPNQRSAARLGMLVDELRARAGEYRHVVLEGYADNQEPDPVALSKARAEAVRTLLDQQIPGLFYEIIPRGAENPIAPNETPYGRLRNRRVQIYLAEEEKGGEIVVHDVEGDNSGG
jgi:phosphate transport system substrate-binding protein